MSVANTAIGTAHLTGITPASANSVARSLPGKTLLEWLRMMVLIREFEVRTMQAYQDRKIGGFCHVYIGQEAVAVGLQAAGLAGVREALTGCGEHGVLLPAGMVAAVGAQNWVFGYLESTKTWV